MDVSLIDYYANHGESFLHKASAAAKLFFSVFVIASVVITGEFYFLLAIYTALIAIAVWAWLPVLKIVTIASYPAIFALLFVLLTWNGSYLDAGVIMLKALTAALTMVILIVTTPYPEIFKTLKPILPGVIHDGLYLTYRSLFVLLEMTDELVRGLKVRGGITRRKYIRNIKNFSSGIGLVLIKGFDITEKYYGVMKVRGYTGKISDDETQGLFTASNISPLFAGLLILLLSLAVKFYASINNLGFYILISAVVLLMISISYRAKESI